MSFFFIDDGGTVGSIAFQTSATSTAQTVVCPSISQYDIAVLFDEALNGSGGAPSAAVPSGFTQLQTSAATFSRTTVSYKVLVGDESGSSLSGMNGTSDISKVLLIFRPDGSIDTVTTSTFLQETNNGAPSSQTISASGQAAPLIRLACAAVGSSGGSGAPSFTAGTFDATVSKSGAISQCGVRAGYTVQNTSPSNDAPSMGDNGQGNCLITGWMRFS